MDESSEHLYDEYLNAAMSGQAAPPEQFLRERGVEDAALHEVLSAVYQEYARTRGSTVPGGGDAHGGSVQRRSDVLGDFRLLERLGEGGMGVVFLAEQISLRRRVAVKLLRPEIASSRTAAARFEREAMAAAKLNHPSIVSVIAVGEHRGTRYIAMEHIPGRGLDEVLREAAAKGEPIAIGRAVRWCAQIARGLCAAHEAGIIHRDVKPSNIRITHDDRAMLLDFGVARDIDAGAPTLTETFIGSPFYAAPEQVAPRGGTIDGRTDVYAAGMVLYEAITGKMPFTAGTLEQVLHAILVVDPPPPGAVRRGVARDVSTAVMKAIDKDPGRRYASARLFAEDLEAILELKPIAAAAPGPLSRVARWGKRNRPMAAAGITAACAIVLGAGAAIAQSLRAEARQREQLAGIVREAERSLAEYEKLRGEIESRERVFKHYSDLLGASYLTPQQDREMLEAQRDVHESRRRREELFYGILELANAAERGGAEAGAAEGIRARAYFQRYLEAEVAGMPDQPVYRALVKLHDPAGTLDGDVRGSTRVTVEVNVQSASVHVFRRAYASQLDPEGGRRLIAIPHKGWPEGVAHDAWALRVIEDRGELSVEDHVLSIEGHPIEGSVLLLADVTMGKDQVVVPKGARLVSVDGVEVRDPYWAERIRASQREMRGVAHRYHWRTPRGDVNIEAGSLDELGMRLGTAEDLALLGGVEAGVWMGGSLRSVQLPAGLKTRTTAAPVLRGTLSLMEPGVDRSISLEPGDYVFVVEAGGYEPLRIAVHTARGGAHSVRAVLYPTGTSPEGFVRVASMSDGASFWIMEREVTLGEYMEFVNDPATLKEIAESPAPIRYPENGEEAHGQRDGSGRFVLPESWDRRWPALHVSWNDAMAYARWRSERARGAARGERFSLPTLGQWISASAAANGAEYVFGDTFHPKWTSSCFARPSPLPEPVRSFPIDESILGVYDMAGSVSEWTGSRWQELQPHMRHAGGSWATGDSTQFNVYGGNGALADRDAGFIGFRLVMEAPEP